MKVHQHYFSFFVSAFYIFFIRPASNRNISKMEIKKLNYSFKIAETRDHLIKNFKSNYLTLWTNDAKMKTVFEQYIVGNIIDSFIVYSCHLLNFGARSIKASICKYDCPYYWCHKCNPCIWTILRSHSRHHYLMFD